MGIKRASGSGSATAYLAAVRQRLAAGELLRVGFLEKATYPDGQFVADVAATNEFGDPDRNQPPRPFFRIAIAKGKGNWGHNFGVALKATNYNLDAAFALTGQGMRDDVQASIRALTAPVLAPATIARKGFDKPLIESSHMLNSVDFDTAVKA